MGLVYAELCTECGVRKTQHPSKLCCKCRRLKKTKYCHICGVTLTSDPDGVCYDCRRRRHIDQTANVEERLDAAIAEAKELLFMLEQRKEGSSFSQIADMLGVSKSAIYSKYRKALHLNERLGGFDLDGKFIVAEKDAAK